MCAGKRRPLATGGIRGNATQTFLFPPNFVVPRKIWFEHKVKTTSCPPDLKTWLRAWANGLLAWPSPVGFRVFIHLQLVTPSCNKLLPFYAFYWQ